MEGKISMKKMTAILVALIIFLIPCLTACEQSEELPYVVLSKANAYLTVGDEYTLGAKVCPAKYSDLEIEWTTSNPGVVSCDGGKLTALSEGSSVVMASVNGGNAFSATVTVSERVRAHANMLLGESISIPKSEYINVFDGEFTWHSSNPSVAECKDGVITASSVGNAVIRICRGSDAVSVYSISVFESLESIVAFEAPEIPTTLSYKSGETEVAVQEFAYTVTKEDGLTENQLMVTFTVTYAKAADVGGDQSKGRTGFFIELYSEEVGYCTTHRVESDNLTVGQSMTFTSQFIANVSEGMRHFSIKLVPILY